jgi:WsaF, C-terminal domain/WsaF, N-terminal domain
MPRGLSEAARNPLASTAGRKRALVLLVAVPLLLAFALGAALGALAEANGWSALVVILAAVGVALAATLAGRLLLGAAQSVRRRHSTAWIPEKLAPLRIEASEAEPRRVDVIHPAIDLKHFFGGFIAVFNLARRLAEEGHSVRLIATERSDLPSDWRRRIAGYEGLGDGLERIEVVFAADRAPVRFNPGDALIATHWTVAHIARQAAAELRGQRFLYLIQEYEPFIFPHGSAAALARQSYDLPHRALFSTALLRDYFAAHRIGVFAAGEEEGRRRSAVFDNAITPVGPVSEEELRREGPRRLLFYARPEEHAQRNLFELGAMALDLAAVSGCLEGWELIGIGAVERGTQALVLPRSGARVRMVPRSSQAEYARLLGGCDVGLALMYTPHPSLVPIEMAAAGLSTVTNTFENKDADALKAISQNLIPAEPFVESVAGALARAAERSADLRARAHGSEVEWPRGWEQAFDGGTMAAIERLLDEGSG